MGDIRAISLYIRHGKPVVQFALVDRTPIFINQSGSHFQYVRGELEFSGISSYRVGLTSIEFDSTVDAFVCMMRFI